MTPKLQSPTDQRRTTARDGAGRPKHTGSRFSEETLQACLRTDSPSRLKALIQDFPALFASGQMPVYLAATEANASQCLRALLECKVPWGSDPGHLLAAFLEAKDFKLARAVLKDPAVTFPSTQRTEGMAWVTLVKLVDAKKTLMERVKVPARIISFADLLHQRNVDINAPLTHRRTALYWAKTYEGAQFLLDHGASVSVKSGQGEEPLPYIVRQGFFAAARAVLRAGARPSAKESVDGMGVSEMLSAFEERLSGETAQKNPLLIPTALIVRQGDLHALMGELPAALAAEREGQLQQAGVRRPKQTQRAGL